MVQNAGIPFHFFTGSDKAYQQPDQYFMGQNVIDFLCIPLYNSPLIKEFEMWGGGEIL